MKRRFIILTLGLLLILVMGSMSSLVQARDYKIVSYIRTWPLGTDVKDMMEAEHWSAEDINGEKLTNLNIAFAHIKNGTDLYIKDMQDSPEGMPGFKNLFKEIAKVQEQNPNLRINLSIGGWGADGFSDMAMTKETRSQFIANVIDWVKKYKFDGVDIDWEYPVNGGWGAIKARPEDKENFTYLLQELRTALDKLSKETKQNYELTFAAAATPGYLTWIEPKKVAPLVDYIKLMTYDFYGAWSKTTGHLANLYWNPKKPGDLSVDGTVKKFVSAGIPANKILLGVPFYGRGWKGVKNNNNGLYQEVEEAVYPDGITYPDIMKLLEKPEYKRYWDDAAKAPYIYNGDVFITYEDKQSLQEKVKYIKDKGLRGIMVWEYAHDMDNKLLDVLDQNLK